MQIAVKKQFRNQLIGSTLLHHLQNSLSGPISIINVDSNFNAMLHFLEKQNLKKSITQVEMRLNLNY